MICLIDRISVYCQLSNSLFVTSICFMFWFIFCFSVSCLCHLLSPFWGELGLRFASYVSGVMINLGICLAASDSILVVVLGTCHFGVFQNSIFFSSLIWVFFLFGVRPWMQISRILPVVALLCLWVSCCGYHLVYPEALMGMLIQMVKIISWVFLKCTWGILFDGVFCNNDLTNCLHKK